MISNVNSASELFLAQVNRIQQRLAEANRQVSSGKRISAPADAPDQIDSLLQLRTSQQRNQQIAANLGLAKTEAASADSALAAAVRLMDRAVLLATQGASETMDASGRRTLAQDVQSLHEQMVAFSRTAVQGRYIFSGDRNNAPAYAVDITSDPPPPNGVVQLSIAEATTHIEEPTGGSFPAAKTAQEIFDARDADGNITSTNAFAALNGLRLALEANDTAAIGSSIVGVKDASYHLNSMQAFYGAVQRRIEDAADYTERYANRVKVEIGQKEDADVVAAALELTQAGTQLQAAFQMRAQLPRNSLFDYIG